VSGYFIIFGHFWLPLGSGDPGSEQDMPRGRRTCMAHSNFLFITAETSFTKTNEGRL
jgi:hypothetical protein